MLTIARLPLAAAAALALSACSPAPPAPITGAPPPGHAIKRLAASRLTAVVVSAKPELGPWVESRFTRGAGPDDADGGSAIPVSADGYFLTADHVLTHAEGRNIFVIHGQQGSLRATRARIVWRSSSTDLALLHLPVATPNHYTWTSPDRWLPAGTPVIHSGIATGFRSDPGKLVTPIPPGRGQGTRFKHDIPLEPGDSGGAVIDARGQLVGVNSAVEFLVPLDTAFFIESEANRPNLRSLQRVMDADRRRNKHLMPAVSSVP